MSSEPLTRRATLERWWRHNLIWLVASLILPWVFIVVPPLIVLACQALHLVLWWQVGLGSRLANNSAAYDDTTAETVANWAWLLGLLGFQVFYLGLFMLLASDAQSASLGLP